MKANHILMCGAAFSLWAVLASVKVRNLKANHSTFRVSSILLVAVLASVEVTLRDYLPFATSCISKCEGTESES